MANALQRSRFEDLKPLDFIGTRIHLDQAFGSETSGFREQLRSSLQTYVRNEARLLGLVVDHEQMKALTDLSNPPRLPGWAISVSHCPLAGGFIALPATQSIGFDIEAVNRITAAALLRIARTASETAMVTGLLGKSTESYFWVAKEAAIKAFGNSDPSSRPHVGEVEITELNAERATFRAKRFEKTVRGTLFRIQELEGNPLVSAIAQVDN